MKVESAEVLRDLERSSCSVGPLEYRVIAAPNWHATSAVLLQMRRNTFVGRTKWLPRSWAKAREKFPVGHEFWIWLAQHGIRRPSPPGPSGATTPEKERKTKRVVLRLPPAAKSALDRLSRERGVAKSDVVAALLLRAATR
jgi:hypothetical protein